MPLLRVSEPDRMPPEPECLAAAKAEAVDDEEHGAGLLDPRPLVGERSRNQLWYTRLVTIATWIRLVCSLRWTSF